jgi:DNA-binding response OmpR family regulator
MPRTLPRRPPPLPPPIILATADEALTRLLSFAFDQWLLRYRLLSSGAEAMEELLTMPVGTRAPVVVLDSDLPGVDGHAILERLATVRPDTFLIVVLSSHADESVQLRSLLSGAIDHLAKPFNVRVLMAKVGRWVALGARRQQGV